MHLNDRELVNKAEWENAGIALPRFDRAAMIAATKTASMHRDYGLRSK